MHNLPRLGCALVTVVVVGAGGCAGDDATGGEPDAATDGTAVDGTAVDGPAGTLLLREDFSGGPAWPAGWRPLGGVASSTVEAGRGRLVPTVSSYSLARMGHALPAGAEDVEVSFTVSMDDAASQGVGLYLRQNGGYLQQSTPVGAGYAVFVEAFRGPSIGVWRERDGNEEELQRVAVPALDDGAAYQVRFRCSSVGGATELAAKLWPADGPEPVAWSVTAVDATPALQGVAGDVAVDAWNTATPAGGAPPAAIYVDQLEVRGR